MDPEEGTAADEADVESKSSASESAIWRLTAGKGDRGVVSSAPLRKSGSVGSGDYSAAMKPGEFTSERRTAAGRVDFVLQVKPNLHLSQISWEPDFLTQALLLKLSLLVMPSSCLTVITGIATTPCVSDAGLTHRKCVPGSHQSAFLLLEQL